MPAGATSPLVWGTRPSSGIGGSGTVPPVPSVPQPVVTGVCTVTSASPTRRKDWRTGCPATVSSWVTVVARSASSRWVSRSRGTAVRSRPRSVSSVRVAADSCWLAVGSSTNPTSGVGVGRNSVRPRSTGAGVCNRDCATGALTTSVVPPVGSSSPAPAPPVSASPMIGGDGATRSRRLPWKALSAVAMFVSRT
ncbi:hypothetical protein [Nonomuraea sp. NPDC005650]|uniref:hypothetical protein n=1 Tax=Nonomuraea sp. NPDC005650 TaxID=3157045 RepID=UPI0033B011B9